MHHAFKYAGIALEWSDSSLQLCWRFTECVLLKKPIVVYSSNCIMLLNMQAMH